MLNHVPGPVPNTSPAVAHFCQKAVNARLPVPQCFLCHRIFSLGAVLGLHVCLSCWGGVCLH